MKTFIFRDSRQTSTGVRLRANQINVENLCRYFREANRATLYLKHGNDVEFPDIDGNFQSLQDDYEDGTYFRVYSATDAPLNLSIQPPAQEHTNPSQQRRKSLCVVRVIRADVGSNGKPINLHVHNHTVHLNLYSEEEANVTAITDRIRMEMEDNSLVLVNNSCLEVHDQDGTRGIAFWKTGSRKIYAVPGADLQTDRGDEGVSIQPKRRKRSMSPEPEHLSETLENLISEVSSLKGEVEKLRCLAFRHKFSVGFLLELQTTFSCMVCKRIPARKPLIACTECSSLIGCQQCTNNWYSGAQGLSKKCPKCRCERGLSKTLILRGFDSLLDQIQDLKDGGSSEESDIENGALNDTLPIAIP